MMTDEPNAEILDQADHIRALLPEYPGLAQPDDRRVADEALRGRIAAVVEDLLHHLESVEVHLARQGAGALVARAAALRQAGETIADKMQLSSYAFSPFFSSSRIPEDRLLAVLQGDSALVDTLDAIARNLLARTLRPSDPLGALLDEVERLLAHLDDRFEARCSIIMAMQ